VSTPSGAILRSAYNAQEFLSASEYRHLNRWVDLIARRPAVKRGQIVNRTFGSDGQLPERHDASDFDNLTKG